MHILQKMERRYILLGITDLIIEVFMHIKVFVEDKKRNATKKFSIDKHINHLWFNNP